MTSKQVQIVNECLQQFFLTLGQKFSKAKSKVFFSSNVTPEESKKLCSICQMSKAEDLGEY